VGGVSFDGASRGGKPSEWRELLAVSYRGQVLGLACTGVALLRTGGEAEVDGLEDLEDDGDEEPAATPGVKRQKAAIFDSDEEEDPAEQE
jgi:hypothetical protein